ncbi:pseudouridylate synthase [Thiohalocapsa marina]|uniref:tRNA pseudouridine synthase C n=1 Tax=Thiohalocapsa marina TaxID=424902 RepID=A0A5M8FHH2_9GAMM|nr:pseudouridine synthase [Thiohalocapsa marina]KAA6184328.1 pseudouridylate synthase [Thiohalocapsa marina]
MLAASPPPSQLPVLYRDRWLIAVHKPTGLLVHRSLVDRHETRFALQLVRDQIGQRVYPVHRLDKPTSGVLLFALDPATARQLTDQFTAGQVRKTYRAIVRGYTDESGVIDHALRERPDRIAEPLADPDKGPQSAITRYRRLAIVERPWAVGRYASARYTLLELYPETGRRHQLRRHMKHIFHPIVGDTTYGDGAHNRLFRERLGNQRLLLAATALHCAHPHNGQPLTLSAPPAADFQRIALALWQPGHQ